jgi:hypothetical protein
MQAPHSRLQKVEPVVRIVAWLQASMEMLSCMHGIDIHDAPM